MMLTLVIPFCFMIFMSASMSRVWSFYNMLQLASNQRNFLTLSIPSNSYFVIELLQNITFFSVLQEENVKNWLEKNIFSRAKILQEIMVEQGPLVSGISVLVISLVLIKIALKFKKTKEAALALKNKLMWSSLLRG